MIKMERVQYMSIIVHEKNSFVEVCKNLVRYKSKNNFVGHRRNNYVGRSSNFAKSFDVVATGLNVQYNYFNTLAKFVFPV